MRDAMSRLVLAAAFVCLTAVASLAQQTTASSETKAFEVLAVDGNVLVVRLPEGTRELTVPNDFRFTVNGQQLSVQQLKAGMKGTAVITTRTTVTPVTVTEVKNGTVAVRSSAGIIVRTDEGVKSFTQSDVDKRGVKIMRDGKPVQVSELREGDRLSATIITAQPPRVVTEKEVTATLAAAKAAPAAPPPAAAPRPAPAVAASPAATSKAPAPAPAPAPASARTLPKTASSWPLLALASVLLIAIGFTLTIRRRFVH
jgi:LPXTG-motif cell wall-anchored protein